MALLAGVKRHLIVFAGRLHFCPGSSTRLESSTQGLPKGTGHAFSIQIAILREQGTRASNPRSLWVPAGVTGAGWLKGSQSQLQFLPAPHTDFVFAVIAEEFGFIGVATVMMLYLLIMLRGLDTARRARDRLGIYLVVGFLSMFFFQTFTMWPWWGDSSPSKASLCL